MPCHSCFALNFSQGQEPVDEGGGGGGSPLRKVTRRSTLYKSNFLKFLSVVGRIFKFLSILGRTFITVCCMAIKMKYRVNSRVLKLRFWSALGSNFNCFKADFLSSQKSLAAS